MFKFFLSVGLVNSDEVSEFFVLSMTFSECMLVKEVLFVMQGAALMFVITAEIMTDLLFMFLTLLMLMSGIILVFWLLFFMSVFINCSKLYLKVKWNLEN